MWRAVVATCSILAAAVAFPARADAAYQVGWWLKASGSVQVVADGNHIWSELYDNQAVYLGRGFNYWWDWYCQLGPITSGDGQGTPLRLWVVSPLGSGVSCLPNNGGWENYWTTYYGWHNGLGGTSGANVYNPWYVGETGGLAPFRSPAELGTLIEVY